MMRRDDDFGFIVQSPYNVVESYHPHIKQNSIYDNSKKLYQINLDLLRAYREYNLPKSNCNIALCKTLDSEWALQYLQ